MNRARLKSRSNQSLKRYLSPSPSAHTNPFSKIQHIINLTTQLNDKQLYKQSYRKIQKIKQNLIQSTNTSRQLKQQFNDIIDLIKGQRVKAKFTIQQLKKLADSFKNQQKKIVNIQMSDVGVNTDQIVIGQFDDYIDVQTQTQIQIPQQAPPVIQKPNMKKYECYYKIACMIDKLKVDYRQILPNLSGLPQKFMLPNIQQKKEHYKVLKTEQILKLQQVFINKLNNMIKVQNQKSKIKQKIKQKEQQIQKQQKKIQKEIIKQQQPKQIIKQKQNQNQIAKQIQQQRIQQATKQKQTQKEITKQIQQNKQKQQVNTNKQLTKFTTPVKQKQLRKVSQSTAFKTTQNKQTRKYSQQVKQSFSTTSPKYWKLMQII